MTDLPFDDVSDEDFIEFFGYSRDTLTRDFYSRYADHCDFNRRHFNKDDESLESVYNAYLHTDYYMNHLPNHGMFSEAKKVISGDNMHCKMLRDMAASINKPSIKILDYGCGHSTLGIGLGMLGYDITLCDVPHKTFRFIEFCCKKRGLNNIKFFPLPCSDTLDFPEKYDFVLNNEVMEHVSDPLSIMKCILNAMPDDGIMYLSTFFNSCNGQDPSHLQKNEVRYQDHLIWFRDLEHIGLIPYLKDPNGVEKGFKKINVQE